MAERIVMYWRDIPAQVIVKAGRRSAKRALPPRFIAAIDHVAMREGLAAADDYLDQWRRGAPEPCGDDLEAEADQAAAALERDYSPDIIARLIAGGGRRE